MADADAYFDCLGVSGAEADHYVVVVVLSRKQLFVWGVFGFAFRFGSHSRRRSKV